MNVCCCCVLVSTRGAVLVYLYLLIVSLLSRLPAAPAGAASGPLNGVEKPGKDAASRGFRELKEALKILESLKNMTVEQLWTGGSPTSPTSSEPASTSSQAAASVSPATSEKPTKEKRFLDDIKKLQENLRKTLDNVAIVEEEKMEAVIEAAGGIAGAAAEVSGGRSFKFQMLNYSIEK